MKKMLLVILFLNSLYANINLDIANNINYVSNISGIDKSIYYSIISIESNFLPYSIGLIADKKLYKKLNKLNSSFIIKSKCINNNRCYMSIIADNKENIIQLAEALYPIGINFDCGLMQISKQHLKKEDIKLIFDPKNNIIKGSNILHTCIVKFKTIDRSIECYNKGFILSDSKPYYKKFLNNYTNFFGDN